MLTNGAMDFKSIVYAIPPLAHWRCGWELHPRITVLQTVPLATWVPHLIGAGDGFRTHDLNLGKVAFYQLNYARVAHIRSLLRGENLRFSPLTFPPISSEVTVIPLPSKKGRRSGW